MDEFVYHPMFIEYLSTVKETIVIPRTFEMIADKYPTTGGQIYSEVQYGFEIQPKMFLFRPQELIEISYGAGGHSAQPEGNVRINRNIEIICMHMRHLSIEHIIQRNAYLSSRLSAENKRMGWGWHVTMPPVVVENYFNENRPKLIKVV
jgi:hypothetical protein